MLLEHNVSGVTGVGCGNTGADFGELTKSIAESRLPTSAEVSRAASGLTLKTDSIIFSTDV